MCVVAVGFFNKDNGIFYGGDGELLGWQIAGILAIIGWAGLFTFLTTYSLNYFDLLRISKAEEGKGADISKHGGYAYNIRVKSKGKNVEMV